MGWTRFLFFFVCLLFARPALAEPKTWQLGDAGNWTQAQTAPTSAPVANPVLDRAQQLFNSRNYDQTHDVVLEWLLKNPKAADRPRAILLMAEVYFVRGDRVDAFYQCDELFE